MALVGWGAKKVMSIFNKGNDDDLEGANNMADLHHGTGAENAMGANDVATAAVQGDGGTSTISGATASGADAATEAALNASMANASQSQSQIGFAYVGNGGGGGANGMTAAHTAVVQNMAVSAASNAASAAVATTSGLTAAVAVGAAGAAVVAGGVATTATIVTTGAVVGVAGVASVASVYGGTSVSQAEVTGCHPNRTWVKDAGITLLLDPTDIPLPTTGSDQARWASLFADIYNDMTRGCNEMFERSVSDMVLESYFVDSNITKISASFSGTVECMIECPTEPFFGVKRASKTNKQNSRYLAGDNAANELEFKSSFEKAVQCENCDQQNSLQVGTGTGADSGSGASLDSTSTAAPPATDAPVTAAPVTAAPVTAAPVTNPATTSDPNTAGKSSFFHNHSDVVESVLFSMVFAFTSYFYRWTSLCCCSVTFTLILPTYFVSWLPPPLSFAFLQPQLNQICQACHRWPTSNSQICQPWQHQIQPTRLLSTVKPLPSFKAMYHRRFRRRELLHPPRQISLSFRARRRQLQLKLTAMFHRRRQ